MRMQADRRAHAGPERAHDRGAFRFRSVSGGENAQRVRQAGMAGASNDASRSLQNASSARWQWESIMIGDRYQGLGIGDRGLGIGDLAPVNPTQ